MSRSEQSDTKTGGSILLADGWRMLLAFLYLGVLFVASEWLREELPTYANAIVSSIIAVPIMAAYGYHAAIRRWAWIQGALEDKSPLKNILSGFYFRIFCSLFLSIWTANWFITQIISEDLQMSRDEIRFDYFWGALAASVPLTYLLTYRAKIILNKIRVKPIALDSFRVVGAAPLVALLLTTGYLVATNYGLERPPDYRTLGEALDDQPTYEGTNSIIGVSIFLHRYVNALSDYGWSIIRTTDIISDSYEDIAYALFYFLHKFIIFLGFAAAIGAFFLGRPVSIIFSKANCLRSDNLPPKSKWWHKLSSFGVVVLLFFGTWSLYSGFDVAYEKIRGQCVPVGTNARIEIMQETLIAQIDDLETVAYEEHIMPEIRTSFDRIRARVSNFLDWYYSPGAEAYRQGAKVFSGLDVEERLRHNALETMYRDDPFRSVDSQLMTINYVKRALLDRYIREVEELVNERSMKCPAGVEPKVTRLDLALDFGDFHWETIPIDARIVSGLVAASVGAYAGGAGGAKALDGVKKDMPKRITNVLTRFGVKGVRVANAVPKIVGVASVGAGAAYVGVPALIVAAIAYVGIELVLLEIEEGISRPKLRDDIMNAIETAERAAIIEARRVFVGELVVVR